MTLSIVQGPVPSADPVEARPASKQGFPNALRRATQESDRSRYRETDTSGVLVERGDVRKNHPSERAVARRDVNGPEHSTGLERAGEKSSEKSAVNSSRGPEVAAAPVEVAAAEVSVEAEPVEVDVAAAPVEVDVAVAPVPVEVAAAPVEEHSEPKSAIASPVVDSEMVKESTRAEIAEDEVGEDPVGPVPGAEVALLRSPAPDDGDEVTVGVLLETPEATTSEVANEAESKVESSSGLSEESERDLEALSQFLGTIPQSSSSISEPLEVLLRSYGIQGSQGSGSNSEATVQAVAPVTESVPEVEEVETPAGLSVDPAAAPAELVSSVLPGVIDNKEPLTVSREAEKASPPTPLALDSSAPSDVDEASVGVVELPAGAQDLPITSTEESPELLVMAAVPSQEADGPSLTHEPARDITIKEVTAPQNHLASGQDVTVGVSEVARDAPRSEVGESIGRAAMRLIERIEVLRNAPPPRTMILELHELAGVRVRVSLEGSSVRMSVMEGSLDSNAREQLDQELSRALSQRGFDLAGQNKDRRQQREDVEDQFPLARPGNRPSPIPAASGLRL